MDPLRLWNESTVCWNIFTTEIPRTYSTALLLTSAMEDCHAVMLSCMEDLPIMDMEMYPPIITGTRAATPSLQSNTSSRAAIANGRTYIPARSG